MLDIADAGFGAIFLAKLLSGGMVNNFNVESVTFREDRRVTGPISSPTPFVSNKSP
jgi:hypothetical protein